MIKDVDEIKAFIILHNYIDHKRCDTIMFTISAEQPQQIKTKGGDEIQLPVEGEVHLWSVLEENIRERVGIVFLGHDDEPDYNMDHSAYQQEYTPVRRNRYQKHCETLVFFYSRSTRPPPTTTRRAHPQQLRSS